MAALFDSQVKTKRKMSRNLGQTLLSDADLSTFKDGYAHSEVPDALVADNARLPDSLYDENTFALLGVASAATTDGVHTDDVDTTGVSVLDVGPMEDMQDAVDITEHVCQKIVPLCQWVPLFQTLDEINPGNPAFQSTIDAVLEAYTGYSNSPEVKNMESFRQMYAEQQQAVRDAAASENLDAYKPRPLKSGARCGYLVRHAIVVCVPDMRPDAPIRVPLVAVLGGHANVDDAIKKTRAYGSLRMTTHALSVVRTSRWLYPQYAHLRSIGKHEKIQFEDPNLNRMFENERVARMRVDGDDSLVGLLKKEHAEQQRAEGGAADGGGDAEVPAAEGEPAAGAGGDAGGDPGSA